MVTYNEGITPMPGIENLTYEEVNIILNIQRLWMELVEWIRNFFHGALENHPNQSALADYLYLQLPLKIGEEFKKHYSEEESRQFLDIVSRMISMNWQLAAAYKSKDKTAVDLGTAQLYQAADELAKFMAGINKYLGEVQLKAMLHDYVNLRIMEVTAFLNSSYVLEVTLYEEIEELVVQMANYTALGIIAQRQAALHSSCYFTSQEYYFNY